MSASLLTTVSLDDVNELIAADLALHNMDIGDALQENVHDIVHTCTTIATGSSYSATSLFGNEEHTMPLTLSQSSMATAISTTIINSPQVNAQAITTLALPYPNSMTTTVNSNASSSSSQIELQPMDILSSLPCVTSVTSILSNIEVQQIPLTLSPPCVTSVAATINCYTATLNSSQTEMPSTLNSSQTEMPLTLKSSQTEMPSASNSSQTEMPSTSAIVPSIPLTSMTANSSQIGAQTLPDTLSLPFATSSSSLHIEVPSKSLQPLLLPVAATDDSANSHHIEALAMPSSLLQSSNLPMKTASSCQELEKRINFPFNNLSFPGMK